MDVDVDVDMRKWSGEECVGLVLTGDLLRCGAAEVVDLALVGGAGSCCTLSAERFVLIGKSRGWALALSV